MTETHKHPNLPKEITEQLDALALKGAAMRQAGDADGFYENLEVQWTLIPEPKYEWDYYPQVKTVAALKFIGKLDQCARLYVWIERLFAAYHDTDRTGPFTNFTAGQALLDCGRESEAAQMFKTVLNTHGPKWFTGDYKSFLVIAQND